MIAKIIKDNYKFIVVVEGNILHTGDRQLHKPCHHLDQQMQARAQSSKKHQIICYWFHYAFKTITNSTETKTKRNKKQVLLRVSGKTSCLFI